MNKQGLGASVIHMILSGALGFAIFTLQVILLNSTLHFFPRWIVLAPVLVIAIYFLILTRRFPGKYSLTATCLCMILALVFSLILTVLAILGFGFYAIIVHPPPIG
ncbi:MAG TPA: hypothetical protein VMU07_04290 [Candidatus Paceibacterota bacterium]|nr:hypothetical protein [Candidatus Paceibacterota bacterium]